MSFKVYLMCARKSFANLDPLNVPNSTLRVKFIIFKMGMILGPSQRIGLSWNLNKIVPGICFA